MKYLFGPVNSRRLGLSLGVDLLPGICNFNCIYCEVNRSKTVTLERRHYTPTGEIIGELSDFFADHERAAAIDVITVTASGEPTLHLGIGQIIGALKSMTDRPVTVLTNGGLLHLPEVRADLAEADIVAPSLDAVLEQPFRRVNRPAPGSNLMDVLEGIIRFSQEFKGRLWLEVLLVRGVNDQPENIEALARAIERIGPERVQLNTVVRPPFESFARPLSAEELQRVGQRLGERVEIIASFPENEGAGSREIDHNEIYRMLQRRPCTESDICQALGGNSLRVRELLATLAGQGRITRTPHGSQEYWQTQGAGK